MLYGGNANYNTSVKYIGLSNDNAYLLSTTLNNQASSSLSNVYSPSDLNMNRKVSYIGLSNDNAFLLSTVLTNSASSSKTQSLPN
jgi:hypothetical protein